MGVYFLCIPFTTYIIVSLHPTFVERRDSLPHKGRPLNSVPYTDNIHEVTHISGLQSFIISVRISIPPA